MNSVEQLETKSVMELTMRLNEINIERDRLDIEYNEIIKEIWRRIPSVKDDPNLVLRKVNKKEGL